MMNDAINIDIPSIYASLSIESEKLGFSMPSDSLVGSLLRTIVTSKSKANLLELGTGMGLSLAWMVDGMDKKSTIVSVDNNPALCETVSSYFQNDNRVKIVCEDGTEWIKKYKGDHFDVIFADTWPGKYSLLDETLDLVKVGGYYVIDDMLVQANWPQGHQEKALDLIARLEERKDFRITKMSWSTGVIILTKK